MTQVLIWSDAQGPQAAWIVPQTPDPDAPVPDVAWAREWSSLEPVTVVASKGNQSWRMWAKHLADNPSPAGGVFSLADVPDHVTSPQIALAVVRNAAVVKAMTG
jgi:hypothetical protein